MHSLQRRGGVRVCVCVLPACNTIIHAIRSSQESLETRDVLREAGVVGRNITCDQRVWSFPTRCRVYYSGDIQLSRTGHVLVLEMHTACTIANLTVNQPKSLRLGFHNNE